MRHLGFAVLLFAAVGCASECPADQVAVVAGESYCGETCRACSDCGDGATCQFRGDRGVCVDDDFLVARSVSTSCTDPCAPEEARYQGECRQICNVDGECGTCCIEPSDIEFRICAPTADMCP
ncbi:MAG: hypothetical protein AB8I08_30025 [Sandaracinaceae bacterium]